jgi:hypothetical protein
MNGLCEGPHCRLSNTISSPEVRMVRLDASYTAIMCRDCYEAELDYSNQLEAEGKERLLPQLPFSHHPLLELVDSWL